MTDDRDEFGWTLAAMRIFIGDMGMTLQETEATATVFLTALRALPEAARNRIFAELARDSDLMEDLLDIAVIEERRAEPSRSFSEALQQLDG